MLDPKIADKIKRLLRLSASDNLNEAASAAAHAQRLMAQHHIDQAQLGELYEDELPGVVTLRGDDGIYRGRNIHAWILRLAACLADLNHCQAFLQVQPKTDPRQRHQQKIICLVGVPLSVSATRYLFTFLHEEIRTLTVRYANLYKQQTGLTAPTSWRRDFRHGATDEVIRRMREAREQVLTHINPKALMRINVIQRAAIEAKERVVTGDPWEQKTRPAKIDPYLTGQIAAQQIQLRADVALPEQGQEASDA